MNTKVQKVELDPQAVADAGLELWKAYETYLDVAEADETSAKDVAKALMKAVAASGKYTDVLAKALEDNATVQSILGGEVKFIEGLLRDAEKKGAAKKAA